MAELIEWSVDPPVCVAERFGGKVIAYLGGNLCCSLGTSISRLSVFARLFGMSFERLLRTNFVSGPSHRIGLLVLRTTVPGEG